MPLPIRVLLPPNVVVPAGTELFVTLSVSDWSCAQV